MQNDVKKLAIVYYIYINLDKDWYDTVKGQLDDIKASGILDNQGTEFHIVVTNTSGTFVKSEATMALRYHAPNAHVTFYEQNHFEYPGIRKAYDLSREDPEKILLYLHSKGMVYSHRGMSRSPDNIRMTRMTVNRWREALDAFKDQSVNKVGLACSEKGFLWFNFWYARASYIADKCPLPIISNDRFYYEFWLGGNDGTWEDCYCFDQARGFHDTAEAINIGARLPM